MASIDFVHSAFKISLRVVFQFDLDVVQCAVLLWVSAIVFFCSTRVVDLLWFSYAVSNTVRCMRGFSFASVVRCVGSLDADASVGDICYGFPMQLSFGGVFFNVYVVLPKQGTTIERSSTYVKAAAGLGYSV